MTLQYIETIRGEEVCGPDGFPVGSLSENRWWIREINRLSQEMDLGGRVGRLPSSKEKSKRHLTKEEVKWWPYSIRPEGYYDQSWTEVLGEEE